ncbi:Uncharacterized protein ToN1_10890 [Aromatoleum petrolei]|nr:Uncharacterized protein ToN1_10890 [Aromatoleum petrolei]
MVHGMPMHLDWVMVAPMRCDFVRDSRDPHEMVLSPWGI